MTIMQQNQVEIRKNVLETIGKHGAMKERRLFFKAENGEINIAFAQDYAQYRQKYIERVHVGVYAKYGITETDIVLVEQLPPITD